MDSQPPSSTPQPLVAPQPPARATWTDVSVDVQGSVVLRGFTQAVPDGTLVGLVGYPSTGLSVALLTLAGRFRPGNGTVAIVGSPQSVAVVSCETTDQTTWGECDPLQRVREAVAESARVPRGASAAAHLEQSLSAAGIADLADRPLGSLNAYERTLLGIAIAAASGASVLAVDVSSAAVEPARGHVMTLLAQLAASGRLVLVASSSAHEAMHLVVAVPTPMEV